MYVLEVQFMEAHGRGPFTQQHQYETMRNAEAALDKYFQDEERYHTQLLNWHILNR